MAIIPNELTNHHMKDWPANPISVNVVLSNIVCISFPSSASGSRVPTKNATLESSVHTHSFHSYPPTHFQKWNF